MRGRKPEVLAINSPDVSELMRIAHSDTSPWYQVRRARIVLGIAAGQRREDVATQLECDESTIWRTCQRYRELGLGGLLADQRQGHSGRDLVSPARKLALNSRGMFCKPAMHLLIHPSPFKRMSIALIVFRPRSQHMRLEFLLAGPGCTFQIVVFERMNENFRLIQP